MRRLLIQSSVLAFAVALIVSVFALSSAEAKDPKPCISKSFKYKKVEAACKEGGQKAAKKLMKAIVKQAKAKGDKNASECLGCHEDLKKYKNTANAVKWLKPYVE